MACNCCNNRRRSTPGYTLVENSTAQTVVTYVVRNWVDKHNGMIDLFVDKDGNINAPLIADALKSELKARGGFTIGRVKFSDSDVDELLTAFNQAKQKNR